MADKNDKNTPSEQTAPEATDAVADEMQHTLWNSTRIREKLRTNSRGGYRNSEYNFLLILRHDRRYCRNFSYNSFADRITIRDPELVKVEYYSDLEGMQIESLATFKADIDNRYGLNSRSAFETAFQALLNERQFNPVRHYLLQCSAAHIAYTQQLADNPELGTLGIDTMLCDYLGAEPSELLYACSRLHMCAAVARILQPGIKYDHMLVLWSRQGGTGKTRFINLLFTPEWTRHIAQFAGKDAQIALRGCWCANADELSITSKTEAADVKRFITTDVDKYRAPYARRDSSHGRTCTFWATANHPVVLSEAAGNRRFWNFECPGNYTKSFAELEAERSRLFAEALHIYNHCYIAPKRPLELEDRFLAEARANAEAARLIPLWEELADMYVAQAVPPELERYDSITRRCFFADQLGFAAPDALKDNKVQRPWVKQYTDRSSGELIASAWRPQMVIRTLQLMEDLQDAAGMKGVSSTLIGRYLRSRNDLEYKHTEYGWVFINHR